MHDVCLHCRKLRLIHCRGLCWRCYHIPRVARLYDPANQCRRGSRLPDEPTSALPGTPEKVAVLEERMRQGVALWHPRDPIVGVHVYPDGPRVRRLALNLAL
jgi:hypothetical protein